MQTIKYKFIPLLLIIILTLIIYIPGLDSRFVLDDFYNLYDLGSVDKYGYIFYIIENGFSGIGGRPLSLLSFAVQHQDWPLNPFGFKTINLIIHIANGAMVYFISSLLSKRLSEDPINKNIFPVLVTGIWLLNPIQVNTVLYTVQRMTMISAFFTLSGVLCYLYLRNRIIADRSISAVISLSILFPVFMLLAYLGKENGLLLPLYVLIIEFMFFTGKETNRRWQYWRIIFLILPLILMTLFLLINLDTLLSGYRFRAYTPLQRLQTESLVLLTYIKNIMIPHPSAFTLYNDDFPVADGLLELPYLVAMIVVAVLIGYAIKYRRTNIPLCFGILWFFSGHILESSFLDLELYFEHRNYLPLFGIAFLSVGIFNQCYSRTNLRYLLTLFVAVYLCLIVTTSYVVAKLWTRPFIQLQETIRTHPYSFRGLNDLASTQVVNKNYGDALEIYEDIRLLRQADLYPDVRTLHITHCMQGRPMQENEWEELVSKAGKAKWYDYSIITVLDLFVLDVVRKNCPGIDNKKLNEFLYVLAGNNRYRLVKDRIYEFMATMAVSDGKLENALDYIRQAQVKHPTISRKIYEIRILRQLGFMNQLDKAVDELDEELSGKAQYYFIRQNILNNI